MSGTRAALSAEILAFPNSEEVLRSILENASIGMTLVDTGGSVVYANQAFAEMFGYTLSECIGLRVQDLVDAAMVPAAAGQLDQLIRGETSGYKGERRYRRNDGSVFWGLVSASAVKAKGSQRALYLIVQIADIDREKAAVAALAASESRWNFALDSAGQGVWDHDLRTGEVFYSAMWKIMRGFEHDETVDPASWLSRVHPDDKERILGQIRRQDSGELKYNEFEYRERHRDGHWVWILSRGKPVEWKADGSVARILGTDTDISKFKEVESRLAAERELVAVTLDSIADGVISTDAAHNIVLINPVAQDLTGWTHDAARGKPLRQIFRVEEEETGRSTIEDVLAALEGKSQRLMREGMLLVGESGRSRVIRECASVVRKSDGKVGGGVLVFQDITESHAIKRELSYAASHDALTELPNRTAFERALAEAISEARRGRRQHALCFMDLDQFKQVNDTAGHAAGDALLKVVARTIRQSCRTQDFCARIGGDEFALILRDCSLTTATKVAEKIVRAIEDLAFERNGRNYRISSSIGVVPVDTNGKSPAALLEQADAACYAEKRSKRG